MAILFGFSALLFTLLGGLFALKKQDKLHLILGFSAGAVIGVAFFDLLPEALNLASPAYGVSSVTTVTAVGFLLFMLVSRVIFLHPHTDEDQEERGARLGPLGVGSLAIHSFFDGLGMGMAFQVAPAVGVVVAAAVLAHDFSDGINTVGYVLKHTASPQAALRWLLVDSAAPLVGVLAASVFSFSSGQLGLILSLFCGFFLYIGASDLLPESHHRHPTLITSIMTIAGALLIYGAVRFGNI